MEQCFLELTLLTEINISDYEVCCNFEHPDQCEICYKPQNGKSLNILSAELSGKAVYEILDYFPDIKEYRHIEDALNLCLECVKQLVLSYLFLLKLEESNKKCKRLIKFPVDGIEQESIKRTIPNKDRIISHNYFKRKDLRNYSKDTGSINKHKKKDGITTSNLQNIVNDNIVEKYAVEINEKNISDSLEPNEMENDNFIEKIPVQCNVEYNSDSFEPGETVNDNMVEKIEILIDDSDNQNNKYICDICNMVFVKKQNLQKHIRRIHLQEKSFQCPTCGKLFFLEYDFNRHILLHSESASHKCELCNKGFVTLGLLTSHLSTVHKNKELTCTSCFKMFKLPIQLKRHIIKVHNLEQEEDSNKAKWQKAKCEVCGKYFNKYVLKTHMERHSETKQHRCDICGVEFFQLPSLNNHMIRHREPKFSCDYCKKPFFTKQEMLTHVRRHHTREIVCTCQHCGKGFVHKSNLVQHIRNCHPNESKDQLVEPKMPKQCNDCGKIYSSRTSLFHHRKRAHENRQYPCTKCNMTFRNLVPLKSHLKKVHDIGETHTCNICDKPYSTKEDLHKHKKRTHNIGRNSLYLGCTLCKMKFKIKHELIQHIQGAHLNEIDASVIPMLYECNICITFFLDFDIYHNHLLEHSVKSADQIIVTEYMSGGCRVQSFAQQKKYKISRELKDLKSLETDDCGENVKDVV